MYCIYEREGGKVIPVGDTLHVELLTAGNTVAAGYLEHIWQETSYQPDTPKCFHPLFLEKWPNDTS